MTTKYARHIAKLSARIFGEVSRPTDSKSMKVVKIFSGLPAHLDKEVTEWYPRHPEHTYLFSSLRYHGLYRDEAQDLKDEFKEKRAKRGKVKPKKGEGKRAMKRK